MRFIFGRRGQPPLWPQAAALASGRDGGLSWNNRNVRILRTIKMSAVTGLSLLLLEGLAPGMIFGWTFAGLAVILRRAVGRIGLRRSATRAPAGRRYASRLGLLTRGRAFFFPTGIGRQSVKLRGAGGRAPRAAPQGTSRYFR